MGYTIQTMQTTLEDRLVKNVVVGLLGAFLVVCISSISIAAPYGPGAPSSCVPPNQAGEYRIIDQAGKTKYVGITNDLERRKAEHIRSGKIVKRDTFRWKTAQPGATYDDLRDHEQKKIEQLKPYENKNRGGGGRSPVHNVHRKSAPATAGIVALKRASREATRRIVRRVVKGGVTSITPGLLPSIASRVAAPFISGPAAPFVAIGVIGWTLYDVVDVASDYLQ
jgi:hypothetical protein